MAESQVTGFVTFLSPKRPCANNRPQFDVRIQTSADKEIAVKGLGMGPTKSAKTFDRSKNPCRVKLSTSPNPKFKMPLVNDSSTVENTTKMEVGFVCKKNLTSHFFILAY